MLFNLFVIAYALETSFFVIGQWLYAFKSYYNSREIFLMFDKGSGGAAATYYRKQVYQVISTTNSLLILLVCLALACCYMFGIRDLRASAVTCMTYVFLQLPIIAVLLAVALCNFRSIVKKQGSLSLNTCHLLLHGILIAAFTVNMGVLLGIAMHYRASFLNFHFIRQFFLTDIIRLVFEFVIVSYIAYVLLRSSRTVEKVHDPLLKQEVSVLVYMQNMSRARALLGPSLPGSSLEALL